MSILLSHIETFALTWNSIFNSDLKTLKHIDGHLKTLWSPGTVLPCPIDRAGFSQIIPLTLHEHPTLKL